MLAFLVGYNSKSNQYGVVYLSSGAIPKQLLTSKLQIMLPRHIFF